MVTKDFALPDLGEGLIESELVSWCVCVGDTVRLNQIIAEVETAKALVELPAPYAGTVSRLYVEPGATVAVGEPLAAFEVVEIAEVVVGSAGAPDDVSALSAASVEGHTPGGETPVRESVLVGYGARPDGQGTPRRRPRPGLVSRGPVAQVAATASQTVIDSAPVCTARDTVVHEPSRAAPPVRWLARERGIDLADVTGTGERGLVIRADLDAYRVDIDGRATVQPAPAHVSWKGEAELRIPIRGVRKATADAMMRSALSAPQATLFLTVDVTQTTELIEWLHTRPDFADAHLSLLAVVAKALCLVAHRTPEVNSRWDDTAQEIVQTRAIQLGIAVATPRGLVVPVIRDADRRSLAELGTAIRELAITARSGKTTVADLSGGSITITNVGVFGMDTGTPILPPGEAVILAVGAVRRQPWEYHGDIALRDVLTLALTFDHRIVDGEQGSRFLADVGRILAEPASLLTFV